MKILNSNYLIITAIFIVLVFLCTHLYYSRKPLFNIKEFRSFTCPLIDGYTFDYPVFEGLEDIAIDSCKLGIRRDRGYTAYTIEVSMVNETNQNLSWSIPPSSIAPNDNKLFFDIERSTSGQKSNHKIEINIYSLSILRTEKDKAILTEILNTISKTFRVKA